MTELEEPTESSASSNLTFHNLYANDNVESDEFRYISYDERDIRNYCPHCHDFYQFGNFTCDGDIYDTLKLNYPRYDEYFVIAKFYSENRHLTIKQVNSLLKYLSEDFSKYNNIPFEDYDTEDSDERTILIKYVKNVRIYERLFPKKKVKHSQSLISIWSILTKLRECDKIILPVENDDWAFFDELFNSSKDVIGYDVHFSSIANTRYETSNVSISIREKIAWFWKPVEEPIVLPQGCLLTTNHYAFDIPFYMSLFYQNYRHLTTIHLHFIHTSTIYTKFADRLPMLIAMSKVWFDVRSTKASRWKLAMEQYLQDAIEYSHAEIYHHLLNTNILRIWKHISTRKFLNKYLALFDSCIRTQSYPSRFRIDWQVRSYVFSRIIQYRFSKARRFNESQIRLIINFFEKWTRDGLYQMAYPCSFFVSRKKLWEKLMITTKHSNINESIYLDRMTALRDLPSINLIKKIANPTYYPTMKNTNDINEHIPLSNIDEYLIEDDVIVDDGNVDFAMRCNALRFSLEPNSDNDKIMHFINILFFTTNFTEVFSEAYVKLKLYYDFDKLNLTTNLSTLKIWNGNVSVKWTSDRPIQMPLEDLSPIVIYKFVEKCCLNFTDPKYASNLNVLLQRREIGINGNLKTLNYTNWKEHGFENQLENENSDAPLYTNKYFFDDILTLMSLLLLK